MREIDTVGAIDPLVFIANVRNCHRDMACAGLYGKCYRVACLLESVFAGADLFYDGNHIITRINNKFYDITGEVRATERHQLMTVEDRDLAASWDIRLDADSRRDELHKAKP